MDYGQLRPSLRFGYTRSVSRRRTLILIVLLAVLFGPVLVKQFTAAEPRSFERVSLAETNYTEISFHNGRQDIDLAGMLFVPHGDGPFQGVVVIHGSGTSRRDSGWYLTLAKYLQDNGLVVLLPDKRGSEKSGGNWRTASFHDLATDTLAAIAYMKSQDHVEITNIGIIGMSQGGWIAPIVASETDMIDFVVSVVGAAVTPVEQLGYEENHNLRQMGFLPGISNLITLASTAYIKNVGQSEFWDAVSDYDPLPYWEQLEVNALVLYGEDDTNVPSVESAARLHELRKPNIRVAIYEDSGHALEDPPEYGNSIIRYDALEDISEFIDAIALQSDNW